MIRDERAVRGLGDSKDKRVVREWGDSRRESGTRVG